MARRSNHLSATNLGFLIAKSNSGVIIQKSVNAVNRIIFPTKFITSEKKEHNSNNFIFIYIIALLVGICTAMNFHTELIHSSREQFAFDQSILS